MTLAMQAIIAAAFAVSTTEVVEYLRRNAGGSGWNT